jgi:hypothetical protein
LRWLLAAKLFKLVLLVVFEELSDETAKKLSSFLHLRTCRKLQMTLGSSEMFFSESFALSIGHTKRRNQNNAMF